MSKEPTLVVLAAGMGSRYGGLKQMDPMDKEGNVILHYSIFDAKRAGFKRVIFLIKDSIKDEFKRVVGNRVEDIMEVRYAFQELSDLPEGFSVPEGRTKPWGTAHAIYACRDLIDGPFCVVNSDDYYGVDGFKQMYDFLTNHQDGDKYNFCMVGYRLANTVTETGSVARGVCEVKDGKLSDITERTRIEVRDKEIAYTEDGGETWNNLSGDTIVSMNLWGFSRGLLPELEREFVTFLNENLNKNPEKCEYFIPLIVDILLRAGKCDVEVLTSKDKWYGVTYAEDKACVMQAFEDMKKKGIYPEKLWG